MTVLGLGDNTTYAAVKDDHPVNGKDPFTALMPTANGHLGCNNLDHFTVLLHSKSIPVKFTASLAIEKYYDFDGKYRCSKLLKARN